MDTSWAEQMEREEAGGESSKAVKAKLRADMIKTVVVAVGTGNGSVQLWSPLQASASEQYTTTSGRHTLVYYNSNSNTICIVICSCISYTVYVIHCL